jgi:hypothetical protein
VKGILQKPLTRECLFKIIEENFKESLVDEMRGKNFSEDILISQ